jgi:hypothetical protein
VSAKKTDPKENIDPASGYDIIEPGPDSLDSQGAPIKAGDTVQLVYGGDYHIATIDHVIQELGSVLVVAKVTAKVPTTWVHKVPDDTPQPDNARRRSAD